MQERPSDANRSRVEVDILVGESKGLAESQPGQGEHRPQRGIRRVGRSVEDPLDVLGRECGDGLAGLAGDLCPIDRVRDERSFPHRVVEHHPDDLDDPRHRRGREPVVEQALTGALDVARCEVGQPERAELTDDVYPCEALVAARGVGAQVADHVTPVLDVLEPALRPLRHGRARVGVDGTPLHVAAELAEALDGFATRRRGDGPADPASCPLVAPELEHGEPLPVGVPPERRPLAVTASTSHRPLRRRSYGLRGRMNSLRFP